MEKTRARSTTNVLVQNEELRAEARRKQDLAYELIEARQRLVDDLSNLALEAAHRFELQVIAADRAGW